MDVSFPSKRMMRAEMRMAIAGFATLANVLVLATIAIADEIPQSTLDKDYRDCLVSAEEVGASDLQAQRYCGCAIAEIATLDLETHTRYTREAQANNLSADAQQFAAVVAEKCNAQFAQ
jgi:hypothetical protein